MGITCNEHIQSESNGRLHYEGIYCRRIISPLDLPISPILSFMEENPNVSPLPYVSFLPLFDTTKDSWCWKEGLCRGLGERLFGEV